ncbi:hypothetical protein EDB87DRAFT_1688106 [Lactarius vividus]|nr:hypothetical protein EDB87DRAFT_1688106 [Lactarius vividus]
MCRTAHASEPPHPERFSISAAPVTAAGAPATDDRSRPVSVAPSSHALSVGRDEPRLQPPPPPRASSPSGVPSAHPSLSLRAREPSRERQPPTFRPPYFRSEFSRPPEDDQPPRRAMTNEVVGPRRPTLDRRAGYREYYDRDRERDRAYWDKQQRLPSSSSPRPRPPASASEASLRTGTAGARGYSEPSDERDRDRDRWYPPPASTFDVPPSARRPFDAFLPRGPGPGPRPRSPGSPPPLKRARGDDGYPIPMSVPPPPQSLPPSIAAAAGVTGMAATAPSPVSGPGEYDDYAHQQPVQIPVPIPILRAASRSPPRYGHGHPHPHGRPMHMEPYGGQYAAYEREGGGRGPPGAAYAREGP